MRLNVAERILLLNVLPPAEGPLLFLRAVRAFRESLGFSEDESAAINLRCEAGEQAQQTRWVWDTDKNPEKNITVGPAVAKYLSGCILASGNLKEEYVEFYGRFVLEDK